MKWSDYQKRFKISSTKRNIPVANVQVFLEYAKNLHEQNLPIIYDRRTFFKTSWVQ